MSKYDTFIFYNLSKNKIWWYNKIIKGNIEENDEDFFEFTETGEIYYVLKNDKKYLEDNKNNKQITNLKFDNVKVARFVGLANIGATCYMNATLQCLINTDDLTRFLLTENNYINITNNINLFELTNCYCELLLNICCDENIKYFRPTKFKIMISTKNPLFQGI